MDPLKNRFLGQPASPEEMKAMIDAAINAEREACAKVCEDLDLYQEDDPGASFAAAIRMRSNAKVSRASDD